MSEQPGRLKLRASDVEDLKAISACLQDAIAPTQDMAYLAAERRFVMVLNRFRWEENGGAPSRVNAGLVVEGVRRAQTRGFTPGAEAPRFLELLALLAPPCDDGDGAVLELVFAGGAALRLLADRIDLRLEDLDRPWPAQTAPRHDGMETS